MDDALSERQRSALVARLDRATAGSGPDTVIPRRHPDAPIPLSFAQRRLWFLDQLLPGSSLYNLSFATRLRFGLDGRALKRALQGVADRHEALRTVFASGGDDPVQVVAAHVDVPVTAIDVRNLPRRRRDAEVRRVVQRFQAQPFDLAAGPLVRALLIWLGPADYLLVVGMHHIIADGWSLGVFSGELEALYTASVLGRQPELAELAVQYGDFAVWQRSAEQTQLLDGQLEYWRTKLRDLTPLDLPTDFVRPSVQAHRGGVVAFTVPADLVARLVALGRSNGATLFMVAVAAFDVVLARWSGTDDVAVGAPIACRQHPAVEALVGFFVNTLVLRVDLSADPTFTDVLQRVRSAALDSYAHQDLPFDRLVEELRPPRDLSRNPLVQVMFQLFESGRDPQASALEAGIELSGGAALFDLRVDLVPHRGELAGRVEYDRDLFEEQTITRLAERYVGLLEQVVHDPDRPIGTYEVLTPDEIAMLATLGAVRGVPGGSVGGLFGGRVVGGGGGGVAVVDGVRSVTFGELGGLVEGLAARLGGVGVGVGDAVGVGVGLSLEYVVAVLAVWSLGAVVVPVEVDGPVRRLGWVLSEAGVGVVVVSSGVERVSGVAGVDVVVVDVGELAAGGGGGVAGGSGCWFEPGVSDRVWVLFTSGSSGRPKGVVGSLSGLLNRLWWWWRAVPFVAGDRVVLKTRPGFVDAVCELLAPLLAGVPVVVADEVTARDPGALARLVVAGGVTHLTAVPSVLSVMFEDHAGVLAGSRLRVVVSSGEVLTAGLVRTIRSVLPGVTIVNLYGSTEISGDATALVIEPGAVVGERIPIGRPIDNVSVVVADPAGRPVPIGSVGELVVGGAALTHGYTAGAAAVDHDRFTRIDGVAMFRTGDLARWTSTGELEYLGRRDRQVKIRGIRIEPAEIEHVLSRHVHVIDNAVVTRDHPTRGTELVAYLVLDDPAVTTDTIREHLHRQLPHHHLPNHLVVIDHLPRLPNGKLDHTTLTTTTNDSTTTTARGFEQPAGAVERVVAEVFAEATAASRVGRHDDFFADLGGHSLLATRALSRLRQRLGRDLPLMLLFERPTVAGFAAAAQLRPRVDAAAVAPIPRTDRDRFRMAPA